MSTFSRAAALLGIPDLPVDAFLHDGDGRIRPQGGSSGGSQKPQTTVTATTPQTTVSHTSNNIPAYLTRASKDLVARGQALTREGYQAYEGPRVAGFDSLQNQAFDRIGSQQVAPQIGTATGVASRVATDSLNPEAFSAGVGAYMNPYISNVLDVERREARRAADVSRVNDSQAMIKAGAFGGGRDAILRAENDRNLQQNLSDITATGMHRAYEDAAGRYQTGLETGLRGATTLAGLGELQYGQEMGITEGQGYAGAIRQAQEQAQLDVDYNTFLEQRRHPYEQLAFMQGLVSGVPYSTTSSTHSIAGPTQTVSESYTTPPNRAAQNAGLVTTLIGSQLAEGGEVRLAEGGIASLMSDPQLEQRMQRGDVSDLAKMLMQHEMVQRARVRNAPSMPAQMPMTTVAEDVMAGLGGFEDVVGDIPDSGVVADEADMGFAEGGALDEFRIAPNLPTDPRFSDKLKRAKGDPEDVEQRPLRRWLRSAKEALVEQDEKQRQDLLRRFGAAPVPGAARVPEAAPEGIAALVPNAPGGPAANPTPAAPAAPTTATPAASSSPAARTASAPRVASAPMEDTTLAGLASLMDKHTGYDDLEKAAVDRQEQANKQAEAGARADLDEYSADIEKEGPLGKEREARLKAREGSLAAKENEALRMAVIQAGLAMMANDGTKGFLGAVGEGAMKGLAAYKGDMADIDRQRSEIDEAFGQLEDLRAQERQAQGAEKRRLRSEIRNVQNQGTKAVNDTLNMFGIELKGKQRSEAFKLWIGMQESAKDRANRIRAAGISAAADRTPTSVREAEWFAKATPEQREAYNQTQARTAPPFDFDKGYADYLTKYDPLTGGKPLSRQAWEAQMRTGALSARPPGPVLGGMP